MSICTVQRTGLCQCPGYAGFELQTDYTSHWQEDTIYSYGFSLKSRSAPMSSKFFLPMITLYRGALAPVSYSTMSGVRCTDLLLEYSTKEISISPTFLV